MVHIQTSPNFAVFPDSLQFPSRLDISGFLAGHFRTCSCFPIRFIIACRFRLLSSSGSDISGLARLPPDPLRILSFPDVTVFHLRTFPVFSRLLLDSLPVPPVPDISLSHPEVSGCFCLPKSLLFP